MSPLPPVTGPDTLGVGVVDVAAPADRTTTSATTTAAIPVRTQPGRARHTIVIPPIVSCPELFRARDYRSVPVRTTTTLRARAEVRGHPRSKSSPDRHHRGGVVARRRHRGVQPSRRARTRGGRALGHAISDLAASPAR